MIDFFQAQTETIQIDDDHKVVIRVPTFKEAKELSGKAHKECKGDEVQSGIMLMSLAPAMLIQSWHGEGFGDAPVTQANIDMLPASVIAPIARRCVDLVVAGIGADAKK